MSMDDPVTTARLIWLGAGLIAAGFMGWFIEDYSRIHVPIVDRHPVVTLLVFSTVVGLVIAPHL